MTKFSVTLVETTSDRRWSSTVTAGDKHEAQISAIRGWFGKRAGFAVDAGLGSDYGQVTKPVASDRSARRCITDRCRLDIEKI